MKRFSTWPGTADRLLPAGWHGAAAPLQPTQATSPTRPNKLFIAVDDGNDGTRLLGGHPQVQTPHLDRLTRRGVLFQ